MDHSAEIFETAAPPSGEPVVESARIETLDVLRGFAQLGILLLNILGMGMHSAIYALPGADVLGGELLDLWVWVTVDIGFEGAMRGLFSLLFGAGVVLFTTGGKALTNYLMHSLIGLFLFTGAGFALVGELNRWMLYPIVLVICCCS